MAKSPQDHPSSRARPSPDRRGNGLTPTPDEFAAWAEHPVSRYVAAAWERAADAQRADWLAKSWSASPLDPILREVLMARADAYMAFLETGLEDYMRIMEMEYE